MTTQTEREALALARKFHETYERLAPSFGYETRPETRVFDPASKNGQLMVAVCAALQATPELGCVDEAMRLADYVALTRVRCSMGSATEGDLAEAVQDLETYLTAHMAPAPDGDAMAWIRQHPDGTYTDEVLPDWMIEQVRKDSGAWIPLAVQGQAASAPAPTGDVVALFDQAVAFELPRISHVHYDSHDICEHFAGEVRKKISALQGQAASAQPLRYEQVADLLQDHARDSKEMHEFARDVQAALGITASTPINEGAQASAVGPLPVAPSPTPAFHGPLPWYGDGE